MEVEKSKSLIQSEQKYLWNATIAIQLFKGHWHLLNNHNTWLSRRMIILLWNHTTFYRRKANSFVCNPGLLPRCWSHHSLRATLGTKNWQQNSCVNSWTTSGAREPLPAKQTEIVPCAFQIRPPRHVLAWNSPEKKENETTVKNKPGSIVSHRSYGAL